jgi:hypothetical protein
MKRVFNDGKGKPSAQKSIWSFFQVWFLTFLSAATEPQKSSFSFQAFAERIHKAKYNTTPNSHISSLCETIRASRMALIIEQEAVECL